MPEPMPSHVYKNTLREITSRGTFRVAQFGELTCLTCTCYSPEFPGGAIKNYPFCTLQWFTVEGPATHRCDSQFQKPAPERRKPPVVKKTVAPAKAASKAGRLF